MGPRSWAEIFKTMASGLCLILLFSRPERQDLATGEGGLKAIPITEVAVKFDTRHHLLEVSTLSHMLRLNLSFGLMVEFQIKTAY
jgi:hypothetical protein